MSFHTLCGAVAFVLVAGAAAEESFLAPNARELETPRCRRATGMTTGCQSKICRGRVNTDAQFVGRCVGCSGCKYFKVMENTDEEDDSREFLNENPICADLKPNCIGLGKPQEIREVSDLTTPGRWRGMWSCLREGTKGHFIPLKCYNWAKETELFCSGYKTVTERQSCHNFYEMRRRLEEEEEEEAL